MNLDMDIPSIDIQAQTTTIQSFKITSEYANLVRETFDGTIESETMNITYFNTKVEKATKIFKSRLLSHISTRANDKIHHWVWDFVKDNTKKMV